MLSCHSGLGPARVHLSIRRSFVAQSFFLPSLIRPSIRPAVRSMDINEARRDNKEVINPESPGAEPLTNPRRV